MLLYAMGDDVQDLLDSFRLSQFDQACYAVVTKRFLVHFGKKRNPVFERAHFHQRSQTQGESVDAFVNDLFKLADRCNFQSLHDEMLRDRFIADLWDARLSLSLQLDPDMTLEKALTKARQSESVKAQQSVVRAEHDLYGTSTSSAPTSLDASSAHRHTRFNRNRQYTHQSSTTPQNNLSRQDHSSCTWCGLENHCLAQNSACYFSGRDGHFERVCCQKSTASSQPQRGKPTSQHYRSSVHSASDLLAVELADQPAAFLGSIACSSAWSLPVLMNGTHVVIKVDTCADVTAISPAVHATLPGAPPLASLQPSNRKLCGPDSARLTAVG